MARTKRLDLSAGQAKAVLELMYQDGAVSQEAIAEYRGRLHEEAQGLLARLRELGIETGQAVGSALSHAAERVSGAARAVVHPEPEAPEPPKTPKPRARRARKGRKAKTPAEIAETQRLQGRYIGLAQRIGRETVKKRFGRDAIKEHGKARVIEMMEAHVAGGNTKAAPAARKARTRPTPAKKRTTRASRKGGR